MTQTRLALLVALALVSCDKAREREGLKVVATPAGPALPLDHPPVDDMVDGALRSRSARRIDAAQLRGSLPVLFGNDVNGKPITWMVGGAQGLNVFADNLGEPDYQYLTEENLETSPMFVKLMDDLARYTCAQALEADFRRADAQSRVLLRHVGLTDTAQSNPQGVAQNLRYLKLRFHAAKLDASQTVELAPLVRLLERSVEGARASGLDDAAAAKEGWRTVCVALVTSPEFNIY